MEFWGVEVKAGQPLKVKPGTDRLIHLSQASLGESKNSKEDERIFLSVKFGNQKLVLGTLSSAKFPQLSFDLVFEKEFELSHNWKNGSVYFTGYRSVTAEEDDFSETESEEEQDLDLSAVENGVEAIPSKQAKANIVKSEASKKPKEIVEKMDVDEEDGSDDEDDDDDVDDESDDEGSDSEADDEEETPKKPEVGKKRALNSATKTPEAKKAKVATPQKTDGKNHATTPKTGKQSEKTPATGKTKTQTPKSAGQVSCKSCSKTFNSDAALQSHSKAKHGGK